MSPETRCLERPARTAALFEMQSASRVHAAYGWFPIIFRHLVDRTIPLAILSIRVRACVCACGRIGVTLRPVCTCTRSRARSRSLTHSKKKQQQHLRKWHLSTCTFVLRGEATHREGVGWGVQMLTCFTGSKITTLF